MKTLPADPQIGDMLTPARNRALQRSTHFIKFTSSEREGVAGGRYYCIRTVKEFEDFFDAAMSRKALAVDTETTGLDWHRAWTCGFVIGWGPEYNFYIPVRHTTGDKQLPPSFVVPKMQELLGRQDTRKYLWNAKYDLHMLNRDGIAVRGPIHDGLILSFLKDENGDHSLKGMSKRFIDKNSAMWERDVDKFRTEEAKRRRAEFSAIVKKKVEELKKDPVIVDEFNDRIAEIKATGKRASLGVELRKHAKTILSDHEFADAKKKDVTYADVPLEIMFPYACADTHYTWTLCRQFLSEIAADSDLRELYKTESKLQRILFDVEEHGLKIDVDYLKDAGPKLDEDIEDVAKSIYSEVGYEFNIASDLELVKAFNEKGVKLTKLTKKSQELQQQGVPVDELKYSVDAEVLEGLASRYAFARSVLDYRGSKKLRSTYVDGILDLVDENGYLHTNFNQNVSTGRMSSNKPNVQNIPGRDRTIRKSFVVPSDEYVFVFIDYSQVELRLTAHYSQDPALLACYPFQGEGTDVHTLTTSEVVMNMPYDVVQVMGDDKTGHVDGSPVCECPACMVKFFRGIAKRVNFGIIYGAGAKTIQRQVTSPERPVSVEECTLYIDKYFAKYQNVKRWINLTSKYVRTHGSVQNYFGRYRRFPGFGKLEYWMQQRCERQAVNFLIQGTAADLFKEAITRVYDILQGKKTKLVNFVHDEMQFYWHKSELGLLKEVKAAMEDFDFAVPIVAEVAYSKTDWASKKELAA